MKKILLLVILCLGFVGCSNNGVIKSVSMVISDEGVKSPVSDEVTYVLQNIITVKDDYETIMTNMEEYIFSNADEVARFNNIQKYDQVYSGIESSDGEYIGEYQFKKNDIGEVEYEFRIPDKESLYNKLAP